MKISFSVTCPCCHRCSIIEVEENDYKDYRNGALVQRAFPYLSITQRETLISGMCESCQEKIFGAFEK